MAQAFVYKAKDRMGKIITGTLEGDSQGAVIAKLREMGYLILNLSPKAKASLSMEISVPFLNRVRVKDLTVFSRQFSTMINSGLSLTRALSVLAEQTKNSFFAKTIAKVGQNIEAGQALSDSLAKYPKVFPSLYVTMARAGETGGVLDTVLLRVADHYESESNLRSKIRSAMAYPVAMFTFAMVIVTIMITFIVPMFVKIFKSLGGKLPLPTQILLKVSGFIRGYWWLILILLIGFVITFRWLKKLEPVRLNLDRIKLRVPVFGMLFRKIAIARFSRTLGTLIGVGVPILQALEIVADTAGNAVVAKAVKGSRSSIKEGETIAKPLQKTDVFPPMVTHMISVGEETGALDTMLAKVADFYDNEISSTVNALTSLIEPLMIIVMGVIIGGILISLYLPMFKVVTLIK